MAYLSASISSVDLASSDPSRNVDCFSRSLSMPDVDDIALKEVLGTIVASWGPNLLSRCLVSQAKTHKAKPTPFMVVFKVLKSQVLKLKRRIRALEAEVNDLKHECNLARSDAVEYRRELDTLIYDYFDEVALNKKYAASSREDKEKVKLLECKVEQAERFLRAMVDLKLYEPVLYGAAQSILQGDDTENSFINAILAASTRNSSPWARIIPAIIGPHTPKKYLSAITLALRSRKDLPQHPHTADNERSKNDPFNVGPIIPSISQISRVPSEMLSESHHKAEPAVLDDLLAILKAGDTTPKATKYTKSVIATAELPPEEIFQSTLLCKPQELTTVEMEKKIIDIEVDNSPLQTMNIECSISQNNDHITIPPISHRDFEPSQFPTEAEVCRIKPGSVDRAGAPPSGASNSSVTTTEGSPPTTPQKNINKTLKRPFLLRAKSPENSPPVTPEKLTKAKETDLRTKTPITARRIRAPTISATTRSSPASPTCKLLASSPIKNLGSTRLSSKTPTPRASVSPFRPLKVPSVTSPIRSRLSTPKTNAFRRPVLRSINLNTPTNITIEQTIIKPTSEIDPTPEKQAERTSLKPSAKSLGKRRGVILVDRDLLPGKSAVAPTTKKSSATDEPEPRTQFTGDIDACVVTNDANVTGKENIDDASRFNHESEPTSMHPTFKRSPQPPLSSSRAEATFTAEKRQLTPNPAKADLELLVDSMAREFSDSDFGSLEMTDSEDESDCEDLRMRMEQVDDIDAHRSLESLPHIRKSLDEFAGMTSSGEIAEHDLEAEDGFCSDNEIEPTAVATPSAPSLARPSTPIVKHLTWARTVDDAPVTSESSSSFASSGSSYSVGSPTAPSKPSKVRLFGLTSGAGRSGNKSPTPVKKANAASFVNSTSPPVIRSGTSLPTRTANNATSKLPTPPRSARAAARPTVTVSHKGVVVEDSKVRTTLPGPTATPVKTTSPPQKPSLLPFHSNAKPNTPTQTSGSKSWTGRSPISNIPSAMRNLSVVTSLRPNPAFLTPSPSQTKPRANTFNALSPLPPSLFSPSRAALAAAAAATKPRSRTINTYSPISRSPLSQHVINNSSVDSLTDSPPRPAQFSTMKKTSPMPKFALSSRMNTPTSISTKVTLPLRVNKKAPVKSQQHGTREPGVAPPTAAFMRPAVHPASPSTRRMSNSIAPLIPNWNPSSTTGGILSPTKCGNMFRNSMSMVVR